MALTVIPTNIGGVSLNSIASPLASLLGGTSSAQNMVFPADLGSNPTMGHAVIFQAYDYKSGVGNNLADLGNSVIAGGKNLIEGNASLADAQNFINAGKSVLYYVFSISVSTINTRYTTSNNFTIHARNHGNQLYFKLW